MGNQITAPVTADLLDELINTEELLDRYNGPDARLNDADHYGAAVLQLEALAKAALSSRSQVTMLTPQPAGARFPVGSGTTVTRALDGVVEYLSGDGVGLMRHNGGALARHRNEHILHVLQRLSELRNVILGGVQSVARADLGRISAVGAGPLVSMALLVAKAAADGVAPN